MRFFPRRSIRSSSPPRPGSDCGDVDPYQDTMRLYRGRNGPGFLDHLLYTDQKTYLVELLMKQDTMSMAASIESRVPFLDHKLVEFAARVPRRSNCAAAPASIW